MEIHLSFLRRRPGSGKWSDKDNWLGCVMPQAGDTVHISNNVANASMIVDTAGVSIKSLRIEGLESITIRGEKLTLTGNEFSLATPSPKPAGANNLRDYMKSKAPLLCYYAGAVISNDLEFTGTGDNVGLVITEKPVTFWGNVSVPNATTFRMHNGLTEETNCKWNLQHASVSPLLEFRNGLNAPNAKVLMVQAVTGPVDYYGTVRANRICTDQYIGSAWIGIPSPIVRRICARRMRFASHSNGTSPARNCVPRCAMTGVA
mgnify:CR=1 FL=1